MGVRNGKATSKEVHGWCHLVQSRDREADPGERADGGLRGQGVDLTETAVRSWAKRADASGSADMLSPDERAELRRLRKENSELRMEKEILRKATAFFAKESR